MLLCNLFCVFSNQGTTLTTHCQNSVQTVFRSETKAKVVSHQQAIHPLVLLSLKETGLFLLTAIVLTYGAWIKKFSPFRCGGREQITFLWKHFSKVLPLPKTRHGSSEPVHVASVKNISTACTKMDCFISFLWSVKSVNTTLLDVLLLKSEENAGDCWNIYVWLYSSVKNPNGRRHFSHFYFQKLPEHFQLLLFHFVKYPWQYLSL